MYEKKRLIATTNEIREIIVCQLKLFRGLVKSLREELETRLSVTY